MTLVKQLDGEWRPLGGVQALTRMVDTCVVTYHDGRQQQLPCDPYPIEENVDLGKVEQLLADGVWGDVELQPYGLRLAGYQGLPQGKQRVGEPRYIERKGEIVEEWDLEDIPPPPPEPTPAEKLASLGLSVDDLKALLGGGAGE